jgi:SAM-dependent methyltransferase
MLVTRAYDEATLGFYDREAETYADHRLPRREGPLDEFLNRLRPGASILELGCGAGQDAEVMLAAGFDVIPTDGSPGLAAQAEKRLGRPVRVMRFEALEAVESYDAVWANACLLHVPEDALSAVLSRAWRALRPGGLIFASYKAGAGGDRDTLGRYYNFVSPGSLETAYRQAGDWSDLAIDERPGGGYDGVERTWLLCWAVKV